MQKTPPGRLGGGGEILRGGRARSTARGAAEHSQRAADLGTHSEDVGVGVEGAEHGVQAALVDGQVELRVAEPVQVARVHDLVPEKSVNL